MLGEVKDITEAYWKLIEEIKNGGIKNFTSFYPSMTLNFQQFVLRNPTKNWLEATGFKYSIFWTLREFSDRMSKDPEIQNPGFATRFDRARWISRIEGDKTRNKLLQMKESHPGQYVNPDDYRPGKFAYTYGERWHAHNQLDFIAAKLKERIRWNHVFLNVWDFHEDNYRFGRRVPCTVGIQFIPNDYRNDDLDRRIRTLDCQGIMRNNLVNSFFVSDIFCFTTLFQWMAVKNNFDIGRYAHVMGKVYYRFKVKQQIRIVNSLNDWKRTKFNIYDHYNPTIFGKKFEPEWWKKEEIEADWRNGNFAEDIIGQIEVIKDEHIRNWLRVMFIGEMTLKKSKKVERIQKMISVLKTISNEWHYPTARELILYIQKTKIDNQEGFYKEIIESIPEAARIDFGKEIIFRSKSLKDIIEALIPGSYERYYGVYKNLDVAEHEFRGDKKAIEFHSQMLKDKLENPDDESDDDESDD